MQKIPLISVPNQRLEFNADGAYWQIHIYTALTVMVADVSRNGVNIINGQRCFAGIKLLPYAYMTAPNFGNFIFNGEPDWEQFGVSVDLYHLSAAEMQEYESMLRG